MTDPRLESFYALPIPRSVADAIDEGLTNAEADDLVAAHLGRNQAYFGSIDKTLAGFVVLDDTNDDYLLADVRGGGQLWLQVHEDRSLALMYDDVAGWKAAEQAIRDALEEDEDADEDAVREGFLPSSERLGDRAVSTPKLLARYQWLVWALSQHRELRGESLTSTVSLVNDALARYLFADRAAAEVRFRDELPALADDPHLAVYWCLHANLWDEQEWLSALRNALGPVQVPLVQAFLQTDLSLVPDVDARRSLLAVVRAQQTEGLESVRHSLRALRLQSEHRWYDKASPVAKAVIEGDLAPGEAEQGLLGCAPSLGVDLVRAAIDRVRAVESSPATPPRTAAPSSRA